VNEGKNRLDIPYNSESAEKMTQYEMKELVEWT
jgi:hypothetical protein